MFKGIDHPKMKSHNLLTLCSKPVVPNLCEFVSPVEQRIFLKNVGNHTVAGSH